MLHLLAIFTLETFIFTKELNIHIYWDGTKHRMNSVANNLYSLKYLYLLIHELNIYFGK